MKIVVIYKFCGNKGVFISFVEIGGIRNNHWLRGDWGPWERNAFI